MPEATWGTLEGRVFLSRPVPIPRVTATRGRKDVSWTERDSDILAYDREQLTLSDAVVFLREVRAGKDWPQALRGSAAPLTLTRRDGFWVPHVQWSRAGCALTLVSEQGSDQSNPRLRRLPFDGSAAGDLVFNVMLAPGSRLGPFDHGHLRRAGWHLMTDDCCFDWSFAHILVFDHPYVSGPTALDGAYTLEQVPPGDYDLLAWHGPVRLVQPAEGLAQLVGGPLLGSQRVTLTPGARLRVDITLRP